jgi:hypothetical protein
MVLPTRTRHFPASPEKPSPQCASAHTVFTVPSHVPVWSQTGCQEGDCTNAGMPRGAYRQRTVSHQRDAMSAIIDMLLARVCCRAYSTTVVFSVHQSCRSSGVMVGRHAAVLWAWR